jgi:hypothetical protein
VGFGANKKPSIPEQEAEDTYLNRKREESEEKEPGGRGIDAEKQSLVEHAILAAARLLLLPLPSLSLFLWCPDAVVFHPLVFSLSVP